METTKKKRVNVNLPEHVHQRVESIAGNTHRTIVGTIDWLSTEAKRLGWDTTTATPVAADSRQGATTST